MYRKRIFYNLNDGQIFRYYTMEGNILGDYPAEREAMDLGFLEGTWGSFTWETPNEEMDNNLEDREINGVWNRAIISIDITANPHKVKITYEPYDLSEVLIE